MPAASTPTRRREPEVEAAAIPIRLTISWVGRRVRNPHLGAERSLALDDVRGDVLREHLDEERLADHDLVDRLFEELGEAGHVNALLSRIQVDCALDLGGDQLLAAAVANPDRLADSHDARAREPELDLRLRGLEVVVEKSRRSVVHS